MAGYIGSPDVSMEPLRTQEGPTRDQQKEVMGRSQESASSRRMGGGSIHCVP